MIAQLFQNPQRLFDVPLGYLPLTPQLAKQRIELLAEGFEHRRRKKGGRYFYTRNDGLQNQSLLYGRDRLDAAPRLLIDPNSWSRDGATALAEWSPSEDGKLLLYAVQDGGTDWRTLKVLEAASGRVLADEIKWVKFSNLAWAKDGSGFYYSRFPEPRLELSPQLVAAPCARIGIQVVV